MLKRGFLHRYLSAKVLPIWTILLIDVFIVALATLLAYGLRYGFQNVFTGFAALFIVVLLRSRRFFFGFGLLRLLPAFGGKHGSV